MLVCFALSAALLMGFANQRGGTCTVAAMEEILVKRRARRLAALLEASLWVAGSIVVLHAMLHLPTLPPGYAINITTISGAMLFGAGAFVNRACIFGSVARIGSGEWGYVATPVGFLLGAYVGGPLPLPDRMSQGSRLLGVPTSVALVVVTIFALRIFYHGRGVRRLSDFRLARAWSPHAATVVLGLASLACLLVAGAWVYSEFFTEVARGEFRNAPIKVLMNLALLGGAILGGWTAGRLRLVKPDAATVARSFLGGGVMGLGASLVPGGSTGLVLIGMPLLWPYAWLAFAVICLTIYAGLAVWRR